MGPWDRPGLAAGCQGRTSGQWPRGASALSLPQVGPQCHPDSSLCWTASSPRAGALAFSSLTLSMGTTQPLVRPQLFAEHLLSVVTEDGRKAVLPGSRSDGCLVREGHAVVEQ